MAFTRAHFLQHRPYLYHFTDPANADRLQREGAMLSAAVWVQRANAFRPQVERPEEYLRRPRLEPRTLDVSPEERVTLNDQRPLRSSQNFAALRGSYEDYIRFLNDLVFFWPGTSDGPTPKGDLADSFASRYAAFGCLRVPTGSLWAAGADIRFCCCNSGAPQKRDRIERGPHIFVRCDDPGLRCRKVAEVVFPHRVVVPDSAEWREPGAAAWHPLRGRGSSAGAGDAQDSAGGLLGQG